MNWDFLLLTGLACGLGCSFLNVRQVKLSISYKWKSHFLIFIQQSFAAATRCHRPRSLTRPNPGQPRRPFLRLQFHHISRPSSFFSLWKWSTSHHRPPHRSQHPLLPGRPSPLRLRHSRAHFISLVSIHVCLDHTTSSAARRIPQTSPGQNAVYQREKSGNDVGWASTHVRWTSAEWSRVLWSDESKYNLLGSNGMKYTRCPVGSRYDPNYQAPTMKRGGESVTV